MDIQHFLATMQATQNTIRFPVEYTNHAQGAQLKLDVSQVSQTAAEIFRQVRPNYRIDNLRIELLTQRVLDELKDQIHAPTVTLTNGCCTTPQCPTTQYLECVLKAIRDLN